MSNEKVHEGSKIKPYQESTVFEWVRTSEYIPEEGKYVLIHLTKNNWEDSSDSEGVYHDIAKIVYGISKETRKKMKNGEIENPSEYRYTYKHGPRECVYHNRCDVIKGEDEEFNNLRPYKWETFGPSTYFGQEVDHWAYIPDFLKERA